MEPTIIHHYVSEYVWEAGYYWLLDTTVLGSPEFKWPLPKHRVYEVLQIGTTWIIMRRKSDCVVDERFEGVPEKPFNHLSGRREGEGGVCLKCGGAYTLIQCPACFRGGES